MYCVIISVAVRIPSNLTDEFSAALNRIHASASRPYLDRISGLVKGRTVNAMLNDASITQQETFEPQEVAEFLEQVRRRLEGWSSQAAERTDTDDLRRLHLQLSTTAEKYELSCYIALQYHALLFYKCDNEVVEIKKRIVELDERITTLEPQMKEKQDRLLEAELKKRGMDGLSTQDLLATVYDDEKLLAELEHKISEAEQSDSEYRRSMEEKTKLLARLREMVFEVYRTKPILIDQNGLMQGEEGAALYFDLHVLNKDGGRSGSISAAKIPDAIKKMIAERFGEIGKTLAEL